MNNFKPALSSFYPRYWDNIERTQGKGKQKNKDSEKQLNELTI